MEDSRIQVALSGAAGTHPPYAAAMPDEPAPGQPATSHPEPSHPEPEEAVESLAVEDAVRSRDDEAPWSVAWGRLPPGATSVRVTFHSGRKSQPAARVGVLGRHWAAEVAGRFDKVKVVAGESQKMAKIRTREKPVPRGLRRKKTAEHTDPLERMKHHWGLAAVILQPGSEDRPELPDIRSAAEH